MQALVVQLNTKVNQAQDRVAAANTLARQAEVAAHNAANVDRFRPAAPPKYGDKKKGKHVGKFDPCDRRLSSNRSRRGLHPVGILLSGGWTPCPVDKCLQGVQEGKRWGRAP
jgi:hypothetical protein